MRVPHGDLRATGDLQHQEVGRRLSRHLPKFSTVERSRLVGGSLLCAEDVQHDSTSVPAEVRRFFTGFPALKQVYLPVCRSSPYQQSPGYTAHSVDTEYQWANPSVVPLSCVIEHGDRKSHRVL